MPWHSAKNKEIKYHKESGGFIEDNQHGQMTLT
jgi:hypothetical protein